LAVPANPQGKGRKWLFEICKALLFLGSVGIPASLAMALAGHELIRPSGFLAVTAAGLAFVTGLLGCCLADVESKGFEAAAAAVVLVGVAGLFAAVAGFGLYIGADTFGIALLVALVVNATASLGGAVYLLIVAGRRRAR
jgi:hypothetical protein